MSAKSERNMPAKPKKPSPPYTSAEVAQLLEISPVSVRRLANSLQVGMRKGHDWLFLDADVERMRSRPSRGGYRRRSNDDC